MNLDANEEEDQVHKVPFQALRKLQIVRKAKDKQLLVKPNSEDTVASKYNSINYYSSSLGWGDCTSMRRFSLAYCKKGMK